MIWIHDMQDPEMPQLEIARRPSINMVRTGPRGGTPLLFLHALGLDLTMWAHQVEAFGRDYDVVAFDLPGHGLSAPLDTAPTFDVLAAVVADMLSAIDAGPAHVVGLSVGGMVAQALAVARPELVRSLTLVATSCTFPETVRQALRERAAVPRAGGMAAIAPLSLERWFPPAFRARRPDVLDLFGKIMLRQDPAFHAALWDMVAELDLERPLSTLTCPAIIVSGALDVSASEAAGQLIADQIAGSKLCVMADCGHFPPLEFPAEFNALLRDFLASVSRPSF